MPGIFALRSINVILDPLFMLLFIAVMLIFIRSRHRQPPLEFRLNGP